MPHRSQIPPELRREIEELRRQLAEANETLHAIRVGAVDAFVIQGASGAKVFTLQGLDAESSRLRGEMLAQVNDAVIATDAEDRVVFLNGAAERLYGIAGQGMLGKPVGSIHATRWHAAGDRAAALDAVRARGAWRGENVHVRTDGVELDVETSITRLKGEGGKPGGTLSVTRDVTARRKAEARLHVSETRYRRLFEAAHDGVLIVDPGTRRIVKANPYMTELLGYPHAQIVGKELFEIGLLKDEAASREMFRELKRATRVRYDDLPLKSLSGLPKEVEVVANLYDEDGRPVIQCNIRDITARKQAEGHVRLLIAEVNHRANNLLAVVQAVAYQAGKYGDPATLAARLSDRIAGLAASQDLLVKSQWQGVPVAELVDAQLAHFADLMGTRIERDGPALLLAAAAAQGIGMALHELATNAAKYGSLSDDTGRVRVAWGVTSDAVPRFAISWVESDGPPVAAPVRTGFGQIVIGRMAEAAVGGVVEIAFAKSGFSWRLSAPMENVRDRPDGSG